MGIALTGIELAGDVLLSLALNPFYYIGLFIAALVFRRQTTMERKLFYVRLHGMSGEFWRALLWGWIGGLAVSISSFGIGFVLTFETLIWVWGMTLIFMLIRIRYACIAYASGVIGLLQIAAKPFPQLLEQDGFGRVVESLMAIHLPSLFALVALIHLAEALLIRLHGTRMATPLYVAGKRGKVVGAYEVQGFWALPLFLVVPAAQGGGLDSLPWPLFFGGDVWGAGWTLLAFPVLIGYSEKVASERAEAKVKRIAGLLLLFAVVIGLLAVGAEIWSYVAAAATIASFGVHELLIGYGERREKRRSPIFVQDGPGLKILDVQPGSPAAELGILRGEVVLKVNGITVSTKEELHAALRTNSAFCRLEVLDLEGHNRFVQRALYDGEHHQLGMVLCPDDDVVHYVEWRSMTLLSLFDVKHRGKGRGRASVRTAEAEVVPSEMKEQIETGI